MRKKTKAKLTGMTGPGASPEKINKIMREVIANDDASVAQRSSNNIVAEEVTGEETVLTEIEISADEQYDTYKNFFYGLKGYSIDKEKAIEYLLLSGRNGNIEKGNPAAQWVLANLYAFGNDNPYIEIDKKESMFFLEAAARDGHESGHVKAQWLLANKFKNGDSVARSIRKYVKLLMASARDGLANGHKEAQDMIYKYIAGYHGYTKHMPKEYIEAFKENYPGGKEYPTPVEAKSKINPSWTYISDENLLDNSKTSAKKQLEMYKRYQYGKDGWKKDEEKALLFLKAACREGKAEGDPYAQWYMATRYMKGYGVEKDIKKAGFYLSAAARNGEKNGVPLAQWEMSIAHLKASKGNKNSHHYAEHIKFLKAAAKDGKGKKGCTTAQRLVALKHKNGEDGFDQSNEEYIRYLIASAKNGNTNGGDPQSQKDIYNHIKNGGIYFDIISKQKSAEYMEKMIYAHERNLAIEAERKGINIKITTDRNENSVPSMHS